MFTQRTKTWNMRAWVLCRWVNLAHTNESFCLHATALAPNVKTESVQEKLWLSGCPARISPLRAINEKPLHSIDCSTILMKTSNPNRIERNFEKSVRPHRQPWCLCVLVKHLCMRGKNSRICRWSVICHPHSLASISSLISKCEWTSSHWKSLMFAKQDSHTCEVHVSHCVEKI